MKKLFILMAIVFINNALHAQSKTADSSYMESRRVALLLHLTNDQEKQVYAINRHLSAERKSLISQRIGGVGLVDSLRKINDLRQKLYRSVFRKAQYDLYVEARTRKLIN